MDFIDLSEQLRNLNHQIRRVGRYQVSSIQDLLTGRLTPEFYFNPKSTPLKTIWNNFELGTAKHRIIERLLDKEYLTEQKIEYKIGGDIVLVGKYDACKDGIIYEWKTSDALKDGLNDWHITQGKIYCSIFDKPKCEFYQPVFKKERGRIKFGLKKFGEVEKDDKFFEMVKAKIIEFHNKLKVG